MMMFVYCAKNMSDYKTFFFRLFVISCSSFFFSFFVFFFSGRYIMHRINFPVLEYPPDRCAGKITSFFLEFSSASFEQRYISCNLRSYSILYLYIGLANGKL